MRCVTAILRRLALAALPVLAVASLAEAVPIELRDQNGTRYQINTDVDPLISQSTASGALTDATFNRPVTVTSYWIGFTPWFGWTTVYTVQWTLNIPLTNAFAGFNGFLVTAVGDQALPVPLVFNPGDVPAGEECLRKDRNRQIVFQTQEFPAQGLALTRKVFVANNGEFARWLNVVTNVGSIPVEPSITLRGQLGSGADTRVTASSSGDSSIGAVDLWFATAEQVPPNTFSEIPKVGFVIQGEDATSPATSAGLNGLGTAAVTYRPTIAPGESAIVMTFVTVQGSSKQAKNVSANLIDLPSVAITCLTQDELRRIVNFAPIIEPELKKAKVKLQFKENKIDQDTIKWKGRIVIGAGSSLAGIPVTVDVGGAVRSFVLDEKGRANDGLGSKFKLKAKLDKSGLTKADRVKFSFRLKGDFKATLAEYGLVDETVKDAPVTIPIAFTAGTNRYAVERPFTYDAKQGKTGTATVVLQ
jgi:hypothetical protein